MKAMKLLLLSGVVTSLPLTVYAQDQGAANAETGGGIADIVVTARKRSENVQSIPVSITAFSAETIQAKGITTLSDIARNTPGLTLQQSGDATTFNTQIRAQNTLASTLPNDPAVGLYIDGVYGGTSNANGLSLIMDDVAGVEVLKGPQGTLYGRNTSGGAIKLDHVLPDYEVSGWARGEVGAYAMHSVAGAVTVPIVDQMASLRVYGRYFNRDGYGKNLTTNTDVMDEKTYNFAGTLRLDPAPNLRIVLRGDYAKSRNGGLNIRGVALAPGTNFGGLLGSNVFNLHALAIAAEQGIPIDLSTVATAGVPSLTPASMAAVQTLWNNRQKDAGFYNMTAQVPTPASDEIYNGSLTFDYDVSDALQFKSITGYRHLDRSRLINYSGSDLANDIVVDEPMTYKQWTEEFTASGTLANNRLKYTLGAFYLYSRGRDFNFGATAPALGYYLGAASPLATTKTVQAGTQTNKSFALYGQATYELVDGLSFTGGVRWTKEKKTLVSYNGVAYGTWDPATGNVILPPTLTLIDPPGPGVVPPPGSFVCFQANKGVGLACNSSVPLKFTKVNFLGSMDYKLTPDILAYAKISTGFRSGGGQLFAGGLFGPFKPESITDYEIGLKADFFDHTLRTNVALYYDAYKGIQRTQLQVVEGAINSVTVNAANATVKGAEFDVTFKPVPELTLGVSGAYTDAEYKAGSYFNPLTGTDLSANRFQGVAKFTYALSAGYAYPTDFGSVNLNVDYWHTSAVPLQPDAGNDEHGTNPWATQNAYGLLNAKLSFELVERNMVLGLWGKNILGKKYDTYNLDLTADSSLGYAVSWGGVPATWGAEAVVRF
jgi:iron complex outermembrane receptor protein